MTKFGRRYIIKLIYILIDIAFFCLAIYIACIIRKGTLPFPITFDNLFFNPINSFRYVFYFWILVTMIMNNSNDLYQTKREIIEMAEIWQVIKSVILSVLITIVAIYVVKVEGFPRTVLTLVTIFLAVFFSIWRILKRIFVNYLVVQGYNNFNVLIIGAGKVGVSLAFEIQKRPGLGIKVVGYLDDFKQATSETGEPRIIGKVSEFKRIVRQEFIERIYIVSHLEEQKFLDLLEEAKEMSVAVRVIPHGFELTSGCVINSNIGLIPILEYSNYELSRVKQVGKRIFDFVIVFVSNIVLIPVFVLIAVLIKLDSRGPVFYVSRRYGRNGRIFRMLKFRSMAVDADKALHEIKPKNEVDGPIFKMKKDPRITKIGRILRKYSLDELPQLLNVLKGDMSLVGPRPLPIEQIEKEDLRQLRRLEVRPGITGLWQIRGRSDLSFSRLVRWDIWYINNWSLWLDLNILIQTVPVVIRAKGAY